MEQTKQATQETNTWTRKRIYGWFIAAGVTVLASGYIIALVLLPWALVLVLWAIWILGEGVLRSLKGRTFRPLYPAAALGVMALLWVTTPLSQIGTHLRLSLEESRYEATLQSIAEGAKCPDWRCSVERREPLLVAFHWDGYLENWIGVCFDQAGELSQEKSNVRQWQFGGRLIGVRHLRGHWYKCYFS